MISVLIDVPTETLIKVYGPAGKDRSHTTRSDVYKELNVEAERETRFNQLKTEIARSVAPLIATTGQSVNNNVVTINLIPPVTPPPSEFVQQLQVFLQRNWPSVAVLLIGIVLISLITQPGRPSANRVSQSAERPTPTLPIRAVEERDEHRQAAEVRLSKLIEQDPDAAAKVIENWIRDAA